MIAYNMVLTYTVCLSFLYLLYSLAQGKSKKEMAFVLFAFLFVTFFNTQVIGSINIFQLWLTERLGGTSLAAKAVLFVGIAFLGIVFYLSVHKKVKGWTKWVLTSATITAVLLVWDLLLRPQGKTSYEDIVYLLLLPNLACALIASVYCWSKLQNELAVWVAFVILLVLGNLTYVLVYGISLVDKLGTDPKDWLAGFIMLAVFLTFNTVLYRYSVWYKRWSYRFVKLGLIVVFLVSGANFVFQITGDRTSAEAAMRARRNQLVLVYNQKKLVAAGKKALIGSKVPRENILSWAKKQSPESLAKEIKRLDQAKAAMKRVKPALPTADPLSDSEITIKGVKSLLNQGKGAVGSLWAAVVGRKLAVGKNYIRVSPGETSGTIIVPPGYNFDIKFPKKYSMDKDYYFLPTGEKKFKFEVTATADQPLTFIVKVWPKPRPKPRKLPTRTFGKGRHRLPFIKAGTTTEYWIAARRFSGSRWGLNPDDGYAVIFDDGTIVDMDKGDKLPYRDTPKFRIRAHRDLPNLVFYIK